MKSFLIVLCVINCSQVCAQSLEQKHFTGKWLCKEVKPEFSAEETPEIKALVGTMIRGFKNAEFNFKADGFFNLKLSAEESEFTKGLDFLNNKKWSFDAGKQLIYIGTPRENLMLMRVKQENGSMIFSIYETPISLRLEKL